ncbi:MAG TPA: hypothetical protein VHN80_05470, partial [Kineosporiaceae bacterium]|nr:hypothetical protein [Kineosporiaceae bacterium]
MTGRLVDALREIDPDVTPAEVSDALWLLAEVNRRSRAPAGSALDVGPDGAAHVDPPAADAREPTRPTDQD